MTDPSPGLLAALAAAAFAAGAVDAVAGGGGLVTLPALLLATGDPRLALGTNKGQSVFGSFAALVAYARAGRVDLRRGAPQFVGAVLGAFVGVRLVFAVPKETLRPIVLVLLASVAVFIAWRTRRSTAPAVPAARTPGRAAGGAGVAAALAIGLVLGAYDGFFGPGTGTLLIAAHVAFFGDALPEATANAKVGNFGSNLASVAGFAAAGSVDYRLALPMAVAQAVGAVAGAAVALRGGAKLIRVVVLAVTGALMLRLAWQIATGG